MKRKERQMDFIVEVYNRSPREPAQPTVFRFADVKDSREAWQKLAWVSTIVDPEKWIVTSSLSG